MTDAEALLEAHEIWAPYAREAERLGFRPLEDRCWEWEERGGKGFTAIWFFYRAPTFLDFSATVVPGRVPRGTIPGFGGVQLYTFYRRDDRLEMALTNGSTIRIRSVVGDFIDRLVNLPEEHQVYDMINGASDLVAVVERHQRVVGRNVPLVPEEPVLDQRWKWMEEIEAQPECC
jgi:hypothetical protein